MLEESKMDKKSINRSSQLQSRASAVDCKKNTELTHKPWPRNNKKREGPGSAPKNESYRKNVPAQRGRGQVDRRPRVRGPPNVGGTEITGVEEDDEPEIGSVFVPGSKKQNLSHLLNFMYPTRGGPERRGPPISRRPTQHRSVPHKHHHDLYLRAYCQFVVKEDGDYKANLLDPDVPIKWELIEEIVVRSTGKSECPICLGTPVAGRVGLCGHVYCWACALHYAAAHDKQPPPCPVCSTPIHVREMKPTRMLQWGSTADEVTMRLVRRFRGSTVVEVAPPRGQITAPASESILPLEEINNAPFCKLFTANKQQVQAIYERERKEIQQQIYAEIDTSEIEYLEQALELIKKEELNICQLANFKEKEFIKEEVPTVYEKLEVNQTKLDWFDVTDEGAACVNAIATEFEQLDMNVSSKLNPEAVEFSLNDINDNQTEEFPLIECPPPIDDDNQNNITDIDKENQAKYFYFYQADDGQQVFLSSLNVRILNASWGVLAAAPPVITGRVLSRDTISLCEQTRKHMPFTAHLPLYCSIDIVELDLHPPHVSTEALSTFGAELDRRARIRARHDRDEKRRERAYRRAMEGPPKPDFFSEILFPPASSMSSPPLPVPAFSSPPSDSVMTEASPTASTVIASPSGLSFAKMASTSGTWRVRKTAAPPPPPAAAADDDDEGAAPRSALSLSDAIEAALHAAPLPKGKKNKKSKQKVLFAMGMQHSA